MLELHTESKNDATLCARGADPREGKRGAQNAHNTTTSVEFLFDLSNV
jgi:hypothetical protein